MRNVIRFLVMAVLCGALASVAPAYADVSASVAFTARCDGLGHPDGIVHIDGTFGGLLPNYAQYHLVAIHDGGTDHSVTVDSAAFYPESDGSYVMSVDEFGYGPQPGITIAAGDSFNWELDKIYGATTVIATGQVVAGGPSCTGLTPPPKANLVSSPAGVLVSAKGVFAYPFKGPAGAHGTIRFTLKGVGWASAAVTIASTGKARPVLKLSAAHLHALTKAGSKLLRVTVVLKNSAGSSTASRLVRLHR